MVSISSINLNMFACFKIIEDKVMKLRKLVIDPKNKFPSSKKFVLSKNKYAIKALNEYAKMKRADKFVILNKCF